MVLISLPQHLRMVLAPRDMTLEAMLATPCPSLVLVARNGIAMYLWQIPLNLVHGLRTPLPIVTCRVLHLPNLPANRVWVLPISPQARLA